MRAYLFFGDKYSPSAVEYAVLARNRSEAEDMLLRDRGNHIAKYLSERINRPPDPTMINDFHRCRSVKSAIRRFFRRVVTRPARRGVLFDASRLGANSREMKGE